jgi:hypothetical protein
MHRERIFALSSQISFCSGAELARVEHLEFPLQLSTPIGLIDAIWVGQGAKFRYKQRMGFKLNPEFLAAVEYAGDFPRIAFSVNEKYRGVFQK